jgi:hypothetical protein
MSKFDVDIDFKTDFNSSDYFPNWTRASLVKDEILKPHVCGVYPQNISIDQITNLSAIPYKEAEELNYFKVDMLHNSVYNHFNSKAEIDELLTMEPNWNLLLDKNNVEKLFQLSRHYDIILKIQPKSVEDLADTIALIRPGKASMLKLYLSQKEMVRQVLYTESDGYFFKRSHAIAYALTIVLQLHLIELGIL